MLLPKHVKYRRQHRPEATDHSKSGNYVASGEYELQATTTSWIISHQIEPARIVMTCYMKHNGKVWIRIFPHTPYTRKPLEVRIGAGKDTVEGWVAVVKPGGILFEVAGVPEGVTCEALRLINHKLPAKSKFIKHEELSGETDES